MSERSNHLLVVAPDVPRHDWNSGDLRLFSILKILAQSYRIHYLADTPPVSRKHAEDLRSLGVTLLPTETPLGVLLTRRQFKAAILEFYHVAEYYLPRIKLLQPDCRVIVDTVDVHFLREEMRGRVTGDERAVAEAAKTRARELNVYARADMVITVTDDDAGALLSECEPRRVRVVPNIHEITLAGDPSRGPELIFVGGFNHTPNADAVVYFCRDILPLVRRRIPEVRVTIVGSNPPPEVLALREDRVVVTGFVPSTTPYLRSSRVSVAPLRFGAGMKGKIGEAMAHGVPVVTTTVGAQGMGLEHGTNVLIADEAVDFAGAVVDLLSDEDLHDRLSRNAIDHLSRNFTPVQVASKLTAVMQELATLPVKRMTLSEKSRFLGGWTVAKVRALLGKAKT